MELMTLYDGDVKKVKEIIAEERKNADTTRRDKEKIRSSGRKRKSRKEHRSLT